MGVHDLDFKQNIAWVNTVNMRNRIFFYKLWKYGAKKWICLYMVLWCMVSGNQFFSSFSFLKLKGWKTHVLYTFFRLLFFQWCESLSRFPTVIKHDFIIFHWVGNGKTKVKSRVLHWIYNTWISCTLACTLRNYTFQFCTNKS